MHRLSISSPSDGAGNEISTDLQCTQSVLDALKDLAAFQITAERKALDRDEGLTKIWMCPSNEMANILFSSPKKAGFPNQESVNIIANFGAQKLKSASLSSSEISSDESYESSSLSGSYSERSFGEAIKGRSALLVDPINVTPCSSEETLQDERIENFKMQLKEIYSEKLASGAQILAEYSVNLLSNRLVDLITETRLEEQRRLQQELAPYLDYLLRYQMDVNKENGKKLMEKYRIRRRAYINRIVEAAEESFSYNCSRIDKQARDLNEYKLECVRHENLVAYKKKMSKKLTEMTDKFKKESEDMAIDYSHAVKLIKQKYHLLFKELDKKERRYVLQQVERMKQKMAQDAENRKPAKPDPYLICSETSSWLCILSHLISDMQRFIAKYIGSQVDLRKLILHLEQQKSELNEQVKYGLKSEAMKSRFSDELSFERSVDSIPCTKTRDEEEHRHLIEEARAILLDIIKDISATPLKSGKVGKKTVAHVMIDLTTQNDEVKPPVYELPRYFESDYSGRKMVLDRTMENLNLGDNVSLRERKYSFTKQPRRDGPAIGLKIG